MLTNRERKNAFKEDAYGIIYDFTRSLHYCEAFMSDEQEAKGLELFDETTKAYENLRDKVDASPLSSLMKEQVRTVCRLAKEEILTSIRTT